MSLLCNSKTIFRVIFNNLLNTFSFFFIQTTNTYIHNAFYIGALEDGIELVKTLEHFYKNFAFE